MNFFARMIAKKPITTRPERHFLLDFMDNSITEGYTFYNKCWRCQMAIGEQLKKKRTSLHLTQEAVAKEILVSTRSISNWENGRNFPDIESLIRLAKLYQISLDDLLLEGSEIVSDIKRKEEIAKLTLHYLFGPLATCTLTMIAMFLLPDDANRWLYWLLGLISLTAFVPMFYFKGKLATLKGHSEEALAKERKNSNLLLLIFAIFLVAFLLIFIFE